MITLGQGAPVPAFRDSGRRIANVNDPETEESNPTLTDDLLEMYFTSDRDGGLGGDDVWYATRRTRAEPFGLPQPLGAANSEEDETSPAISLDGRTLWVASERDLGLGGFDIWRLTRASREQAWGSIENVVALNSDSDDIPRPLGQGELVMPLASRRTDDEYQTFLASRSGTNAEFDTLQPLAYLWEPGISMVDGFLTNDGLLLFYNREPEAGEGDLYMAWRTSLDEPFGRAVPLPLVNTDQDERDPWLSSDGKRFFFSSDRRDGRELDIYATIMELPPFE